jgi:hypothetical protein
MKKILFVQQNVQPPGGGQAVAAWMLEALKQPHAISVLTWNPMQVEPINRFYGTSLKTGGIILWHDYRGSDPCTGDVRRYLDELSQTMPLVRLHGTCFARIARQS